MRVYVLSSGNPKRRYTRTRELEVLDTGLPRSSSTARSFRTLLSKQLNPASPCANMIHELRAQPVVCPPGLSCLPCKPCLSCRLCSP
jgi:hypothetical protein